MNARWYGVATATALSLLSAPAVAGQSPQAPVLLRLAPPEGQVSRYALSVETEMDGPMMPSSGPLISMRLLQTQTVLGVEDEVIRYRTTIDSTTMAIAMPGMDMVPDLAGSSFTTEFDTRGQQLRITGLESPPEVAGFSPGSLSSYFVLPEEEVSPGASWTRNAPLNMPMSPAGSAPAAEVAMTYTFVSLEGSLATLSFEGPIDIELDMAGMGVGATGTMTGTMVVDLAEGRFRSQTSQTSLDMDMGAMTMKTISRMTMELLPNP
ncbi:MAG: DUF6263 family protein [Gemmatimonadetes bacterium]|nr:DUF6263 family protein [Gemmatimonadota bacterium]